MFRMGGNKGIYGLRSVAYTVKFSYLDTVSRIILSVGVNLNCPLIYRCEVQEMKRLNYFFEIF